MGNAASNGSDDAAAVPTVVRTVGRYALCDEIAAGGMATVHLGRLVGPVGFSRTVAIKRLHAHFAKDPDFVAMFLDEARLVARIRHPNVVPTVDVVQEGEELLLVMEYVQGESLARLVRRSATVARSIPVGIVASIFVGVLHGLHAAHEAKGENGESLHLVHRDVSPQNILVGVDGVARLLDFGVAKATQRSQSTRDGQVKGKLAYMAPEQISSDVIDRRSDIFAAGVVFWEALTNTRLFDAQSDARVMAKVLAADVQAPSAFALDVPKEVDAICLRALAVDPKNRFQTAREMALALEKACPLAPASEVGGWVESLAHEAIVARAARVSDIESRSNIHVRAAIAAEPEVEVTFEDPDQLSDVRPLVDPRRKLMFVAMAAAVLLVGLVVVLLLRTPASPDATSASASVSAGPPQVPPPPSAQAVVAPPPPMVVPSNAVKSPAPLRSAARVIVAAPPKARDCAQPFTIDSSGIKHIKPECM